MPPTKTALRLAGKAGRELEEVRDLVSELRKDGEAASSVRKLLYAHGHCGDGDLVWCVEMAFSRERARGSGDANKYVEALCEASDAFPDDWTGTVAERVRRAIRKQPPAPPADTSSMDQHKRDRATIEALKIALEQAAERIYDLVPYAKVHPAEIEACRADVSRFEAMSTPEWEALPVELNAPSGDA